MLKLNTGRLFLARGIDNPGVFLIGHGCSKNNATRIANSRYERLDLKTVEKLCVILNCTPNDLLEWTPDSADQAVPSHPLYPLRKWDAEQLMQLTRMINSIPLDGLAEVAKAVEEIKRKKAQS